MSGTHEFTVRLHLDDEQYQRLHRLHDCLQEQFPGIWETPDSLFESMIITGSRILIDRRLDEFAWRCLNGIAKRKEA